MGQKFTNYEIVTLAVYMLGGDKNYINTEDVAIKADQIAPHCFTWRKYPDQINLEIVRVYLSDAKKPKNGGYLLGSGTNGWLLTEKGFAFAQKNIKKLKNADLSQKSMPPKEKQRWRRERVRLLSSEAFRKFKLGKISTITRYEAEGFFRVDSYILGEARERKIIRILNTFGDDPELGKAVKTLASKVRGGG